MMELNAAFAELEKAIQAIEPEPNRYFGHLSPGLAAAELTELLADQPYQLPNDLMRLYQWHNGEISGAPDRWRFSGTSHYFLPLQSALLDEEGYELRRELLGYSYDDEIPAELDAPGYIVLFDNAGGDEYLVPCWDRPSKSSAIYANPKSGDVDICYQSVADLIHTLATCYHEGVFSLQDGKFYTDYSRWLEVNRRVNPDAGYWNR